MRRGDVYLADLGTARGSEQSGRRPVLVFEDNRLLRVTLTVVVIPFTTSLRLGKLPTCTLVPAGEGGLRQDSVAVCHQMRGLDKSAFLERWGTLPDDRTREVERTVLRTLGVKQ